MKNLRIIFTIALSLALGLAYSAGNIIAEYTTHYEYDNNGDTTKITDALGFITTFEYNQIRKVSAMVDGNGNRTEYEFNNRGFPSKTIYPDGLSEIIEYDPNGNVIANIDRAGRITKKVYDAVNRLKVVIMPDDTPNDDTDNPRITNGYDAGGRLTTITDALGNITTFEYNSINLRTKIIDALGNETSFVYNNLRRKTQTIDALGRIKKYEYDLLGNLLKTIFPDNTPNDDSDNLFITSEYDKKSQKISETDLKGNRTSFEYTKGGNIKAVIDALNQRTEYGYSQRANQTSQTDANGNITHWVYDALSRVSVKTLPNGQTESYTYDGVGNMITKTDFNGDTTTYEYNNLNQLTKIIYTDSSQVTTTYTLTDQIASTTEPHGVTAYQYDAEDRVIRIYYPDSNFITYLYDKNGNRTQVKTANNTTNYTFDPLNRIATITDNNGVTSYTYNPVGRKATQTNPNGTVVTYSYDLLNRLTNIIHTDASNNIFASYEYTLGENGNRERVTEFSGRIVNYLYDELYRLIREDITDPVNGNHLSEFSYDNVGNRLQHTKDGVTTTYVYNNNDQLLSETTSSSTTIFTYDDNGNTLTKTIDGTLNSTYTYNKINRLVHAVIPNKIITNTYDISGIRLSQNIDGTITKYLVDPNRGFTQVLEELDSTNTVKTSYTYGDDLIGQTNTQGTFTYGYDGLGSTRFLTDTNGIIQAEYDYEVFGTQSYQFGFIENKYLYTGEQYDGNLDFYYLRSRYYNSKIGRFQNMDTFMGIIGNSLSLNKYNYVVSNPANLVDPSGLYGLTELNIIQDIQSILRKQGAHRAYRVIYKKSGCFLIEYATGELVTKGIYMFLEGGGLPYVGQTTVDFDKRIKQHVAQMKRTVSRILGQFHISSNIKGPILRELEQVIIDIFGKPKINLSNDINALNAKKRKAMKKIGRLCK